jgi:ubiquinone/menaquinone biosynthesis C-methylase UbiE
MIPPARLVELMVDFFDAFAPDYDTWAGGLNARVADRLVEWAEPRRGWQCLDVGTGTGLVARRLAQRVGARGSVIGIDLSEAGLQMARQEAPAHASFVGMAAEQLIFRDETFDLVTYGQSVAYLLEPTASVEEAFRVLRQGGRIALSCPRRSLNTEAQQAFNNFLNDVGDDLPFELPRQPDERAHFGEPEVLAGLLGLAGFEDVSCTQMVTGDRARTSGEWIDLMAGVGPYNHAVISSLGPVLRQRLEAELNRALAPLGEDAFHYHHSFTFARAARPR